MHKYSTVLTHGKILFDRIAASAEVQTDSEPFSMVASNGQRVPAWVLKFCLKHWKSAGKGVSASLLVWSGSGFH